MAGPTVEHDRLRLDRRLPAARQPAAASFFAGAAGQLGPAAERSSTATRFTQAALLAPAAARSRSIADLGCGTGQAAASCRPTCAAWSASTSRRRC